MKIIHTSDWHIGQNFYRYDREDEHRCFFGQLRELLEDERPDALLVSGDIFHTSTPAISSQRMLVDETMALKQASPNTVFVITAGNHDSASRIETHSSLWHKLGVHMIGGSRREEDGTFDPNDYIVELPGAGIIIAAPFFHPANFPAATADTAREERQSEFFSSLLQRVSELGLPVVMMAHIAVDGCDIQGHEDSLIAGMQKEELSSLGMGYDYLALGHIHKPQRISERAYYSGSPLPVSFSEEYDHYVNIVQVDHHGDVPRVERRQLALLRRVKTLPREGAPLDDAIKALSVLDDEDNSYVRLLIDQDGPLTPDAEDRARNAAKGKACRFCELRIKPRKRDDNGERLRIVEVSEFTNIKPIDIAKSHYETKYGASMNESLLSKMNKAINEAIEETDR